jgi:hypothetical protein
MVTETTVVPPGWVSQALSWVGLRWPEGDTGRISAAGGALEDHDIRVSECMGHRYPRTSVRSPANRPGWLRAN